MKNAFKIAATINVAIASLAFLTTGVTVYPIILTILSVIYITLGESQENLYEKKSLIILLAIITLFINPISGIILLIGQDKIPKEIKNDNKKKLTKEEKKTITLLNLGVGLVGLSGIILTTTNWNIMSDIVKISIIILISLLFMGLSIISEKKLKIELLAKNYWLLSMLFIILTVIENGYLGIISKWLSFNGNGHYLYTALTSIIISLLSLITHTKYNKQIYKNISYLGIIASIVSILLHFEIEKNVILIIINIALLIINTIKNNIDIKEISKYLTFGIAIMSIILMNEASNAMIMIALAVITITNLIIITIKSTKLEAIISSILINIIIIATLCNIQNPLELSEQMMSLIAASIYSMIYILNLLKLENIDKSFKKIMNIIINITFAFLLLINTDNKIILTFISALITLTSLLNYSKNTIKSEKVLLPIKTVIFTISSLALLKENINIDTAYILIGIYVVIYAIHKLVNNKKIQKISIILYFILFIITLFETTQLIPAIINIIVSLLVLALTIKDESTKKLKLSYIATLLAIATTFAYTNILDTTQVNNGIIILIIYTLFTLINCKNKNLNKISYLSIILPLYIITTGYIDDYEITQIINNSIAMYIVLLLNIFLVKDNKDRNILSTILIAIIMMEIIFTESWMIGLYVGVISLILIIIGYIKKEFKGLFIEGIIITVVNILVQLKYALQELPLWLYTLLAGLIIIGLVTYKIIKDNEK